MAKTIIKKEKTALGIEIRFEKGEGKMAESMHFDDEIQLKAFVYFLNLMVSMNAATVEVE